MLGIPTCPTNPAVVQASPIQANLSFSGYATPLRKHGKCLSSAACLWTHYRCALPSNSEGLLYQSPDISLSSSSTVHYAITCSNQASLVPASRPGLHEDAQVALVEGAMHLHANAIGSHDITCVYDIMCCITSCQPLQGCDTGAVPTKRWLSSTRVLTLLTTSVYLVFQNDHIKRQQSSKHATTLVTIPYTTIVPKAPAKYYQHTGRRLLNDPKLFCSTRVHGLQYWKHSYPPPLRIRVFYDVHPVEWMVY